MGNRANYVLIEDGRAQIYFTRWGALDIPATLLSGPEATIAYARSLTPDNSLLTDTWAEGGVLLDVDARHLSFWGGYNVEYYPYLRRPLLAALRLLWPYWLVDWATFGVAELARAVGCDLSAVYESDFDNVDFLQGIAPLLTAEQLLRAQAADAMETALTIRWRTGEVKDYRFSRHWNEDESDGPGRLVTPIGILSLGPKLLNIMYSQPTMALPQEGGEREPEVAYVDEEAQILWLGADEFDPRYLEALARRWPGWQVQGHTEGVVRQALLSGRDPTALMVPQQRAIDELIEELTRDHAFNPFRLAQAIQQALPPEEQQGEVKFGVGFFSQDQPPLVPEERREMLRRLFQQTLEKESTRKDDER